MPVNHPGRKGCLFTEDLPLHTNPHKLSIDPVPLSKVTNPSVVRLKLHKSSRVHRSFNVHKVKSFKESALFSASEPPLPPCIIDGDPVYTVQRLLTATHKRQGSQYLWNGRATDPKSTSRFPPRISLPFTGDFLRTHPPNSRPEGVNHKEVPRE